MTAPVSRDAAPGVAARPRPARPTAAGPAPRPRRRGPAGRWPRCQPAANRGPVVGVEQLDVLDAGHQRLRPRAVGARTSSAARTAASPIAWIWRRDPAGGRPGHRARAGRRARSSTRRAAGRAGWVGPARARCPRGAPRSATRASRRRSTSASRPRARPSGSSPRRAPAAQAPRDRRSSTPSSRMQAWTRTGSSARVGQAGIDRERHRRGRGRARRRPGRGRRRRPARASSAADALDRRRERRPAPCGGMWTVTSRAAASWRTPVGRPSAVAPDDAAGRVRRHRSRPAPARRGWPTGRGGRAPRSTRAGPGRRARGRRRSASGPSGRSPSRGPPATRRGRSAPSCAARIRSRGRRSSVAAAVRSTWRVASAAWTRWRCASVRPGIADLVGRELDAPGERVGRGVSRNDLGAGEGHPPVADPDRLDPAEAAVTREGRDAAGDEGVERHGRSG